jgi:hypothetical protein
MEADSARAMIPTFVPHSITAQVAASSMRIVPQHALWRDLDTLKHALVALHQFRFAVSKRAVPVFVALNPTVQRAKNAQLHVTKNLIFALACPILT